VATTNSRGLTRTEEEKKLCHSREIESTTFTLRVSALDTKALPLTGVGGSDGVGVGRLVGFEVGAYNLKTT